MFTSSTPLQPNALIIMPWMENCYHSFVNYWFHILLFKITTFVKLCMLFICALKYSSRHVRKTMFYWSLIKLLSAANKTMLNLSVHFVSFPGECYSRNESCALNYISTFLLPSLGRYLCGGLLFHEGTIRPVASVSELTWFSTYIFFIKV
jgi:hypothetical protein